MAISAISGLSNYIRSMGKCYVFTGSATVTGGLTALGATEGEVQVEETFKYNDLTAPEWTGDAIHARDLDGQNIKITVPIIMGDPTLYNRISPIGVKGGGRSKPTPVTTTTLLLMPVKELTSTMSLSGSTWTPTVPIHAVWLWKAVPMPGRWAFKHGDGGKVIREVVFEPLFDDTKPEGQKLYSLGDPVGQGVTGLAI